MSTLIGNTDSPDDILDVDSTVIHKEVKGAFAMYSVQKLRGNLKKKM